MISRSLNYYNYLPHFTKFINYYDKYSYVDCSLIVPYQFLASPGSDILFQLDKHRKPIVAGAVGGITDDPFLFTLSDKVFLYNMGTLSDMGEVQLMPTDSDYTMLITYFNETINPFKTTAIKNISGGFLVANEHNLLSYSYDSSILAHKKFDQDESIRNMFLITSNHVAVGLKKGHIDVYNIFTGDLVLQEKFDVEMKNFYCNLENNYIYLLTNFQKANVLVCVLLDSMTLTVYKVVNSSLEKINHLFFKEKSFNEVELQRVYQIPFPGFGVESLRFLDDKNSNSPANQMFMACLSDGTIILVRDSDNIEMLKPRMKKRGHVSFKIVDKLADNFLLLGSNKSLYFSAINDKKKLHLVELPGQFSSGVILSANKAAGINAGVIHLFYISCNFVASEYRFGKNIPINAHFDDITCAYSQTGYVLLTASRDTTVKMFFMTPQADVSNTDFDRTELGISNVCMLDDKHVISTEKSK